MQREQNIRNGAKLILPILMCVAILAGIYGMINAKAATTYTLSGVWRFRDELLGYDFDGNGGWGPGDASAHPINFTSNGLTFFCIYYDYYAAGVELIYKSTDSKIMSVVAYNRMFSKEWEDDAYRTIDFGPEPQEIDEDFYKWFTSYADPVTVMVMFDGNGGKHYSSTVNDYTMGTISMNLQVGTYYTFPEKNPARANYSFSGWYTASDGGTRVTSSTEVTETSTHRLYAHWSGNLSPQSKIGDF